ncbi:AMP-binding enzyme [Tricladium varicosporioides]|nr:AMP-binding enzyme [Hymenoscyphus varicosporioides]
MRIYKESNIPIPLDLNLTELLHQNAGNTPLPESHLIATDSLTNRSITIGELRDRAGRIANGLKTSLNPSDGDKWALILPNCVEYIELFHALLWAGGVGCPINHALKPAEIAHALVVSQPKFIFAYSEALPRIVEGIKIARKELAEKSIYWSQPKVITVIGRVSGYRHVPDDFLSDQKLAIPHYNDTSTRLASIHLSSGTTGQPKGVKLTHFNFIANCYQLYAHDPPQFHRSSRTVAFTPFVHIAMTTMPLFFGPWTGMFHHAMPSFSLPAFGPLVSSVRPTSYQGVPSIALALANTDITTKHDFSQAEVINCGGAPMKKDLVERLESRAPWQLVQVYGMTEGAPYIAYQKMGEKLEPGTIGHFLPNIEARLMVEGKGQDAPEGGPGELWLRGPNICIGYTDEQANTKAFPERGWYNTGDVCTISGTGIVSVVGRTKELIKYKGFQVSPAELEAHLNSHEYVVEAGVSAVWDESQLTELPTAYVVLKPHVEAKNKIEVRRALKDIHAKTDEMVSGYKKLRGGVWSVSALPKNATGKFVRKELGRHKTGHSSLDSAEERARL